MDDNGFIAFEDSIGREGGSIEGEPLGAMDDNLVVFGVLAPGLGLVSFFLGRVVGVILVVLGIWVVWVVLVLLIGFDVRFSLLSLEAVNLVLE